MSFRPKFLQTRRFQNISDQTIAALAASLILFIVGGIYASVRLVAWDRVASFFRGVAMITGTPVRLPIWLVALWGLVSLVAVAAFTRGRVQAKRATEAAATPRFDDLDRTILGLLSRAVGGSALVAEIRAALAGVEPILIDRSLHKLETHQLARRFPALGMQCCTLTDAGREFVVDHKLY